MQSGAPQAISTHTIPYPRLLLYLGVFSIRQVFPTALEMLRGVLHMKNYTIHQVDAGNGWKEGTAICGGFGAQCAEEAPVPSFVVCTY
jgi:hypothetical protein